MARKRKSPVAPPEKHVPDQQYDIPGDAPWGGFINIRLDDEQRTEFYNWLEPNTVHFPAMFDDMLGEGVKASFSFDAEHDCYICSVTGALVGFSPDTRYASTSRASTLNEVIALTVWKHFELCRGDYGNYSPKHAAFMKWG